MQKRKLDFALNVVLALGGCDSATGPSSRVAVGGIAGDDSSLQAAADGSDQAQKDFQPLSLVVNSSAIPPRQTLALASESLDAVTVAIQGGSYCWDRPDGEYVLKAGDRLLFNLKAKNCGLKVKRVNVGSMGQFSAVGDPTGLDTASAGQSMLFASESRSNDMAQVKVEQSPFDNDAGQLKLTLRGISSDSVSLKKVSPECAFLPMHVALVLDASGSMAGRKWEQARDGVLNLATKLHLNDIVHDELDIVTFNTFLPGKAKQVMHLPREGESTVTLTGVLFRQHTEGGTNIVRGFSKGFDAIKNKGGFKVLIILTDGFHTDRAESFVPEQLKNEALAQNVTVISIGYGIVRRNPTDYVPSSLRQNVDAVRGLATEPTGYINAWQNITRLSDLDSGQDDLSQAFVEATRKLPCPR